MTLFMTTKKEMIDLRFSEEKKNRLVKELKRVFNDKDFIHSTLCILKTDSEVETLLSYIEENPIVEASDIILFTLDIKRNRQSF